MQEGGKTAELRDGIGVRRRNLFDFKGGNVLNRRASSGEDFQVTTLPCDYIRISLPIGTI